MNNISIHNNISKISQTSVTKPKPNIDKNSKPKKVVSFSIKKNEEQENNIKIEKKEYSSPKHKKRSNTKIDILNRNYDEIIEKLKRSPPRKLTKKYDSDYENNSKQSKSAIKSTRTLDNTFRTPLNKMDSKVPKNKDNYNENINLFKSKSIDLKKKTHHFGKLLSHAEEIIKNFTNTETISDFYEYTEKCMSMILDLDPSKQNKIKDKVNFNFPPEESYKKIALFDLDETLVHCTGEINKGNKKYQNIVEVTLPSKKTVKIGVNIRPFWKEALDLIKDKYHIVIFTASHQSYADAVLNFMDPEKKYSKYRLYRNNCVLNEVDGVKFYVKDLGIFDQYYNLKNIILIDNSVLSFSYHLDNGIPIVPYYDADEDGELEILGYYLLSIYEYDDLRKANQKHIRIEYFLEQARKQREEEEEEEEEEIKEEDLTEEEETNDTNNINSKESANLSPKKKSNVVIINKRNSDIKVNSIYNRLSVNENEIKLSFDNNSDEENNDDNNKKKYSRRKRNYSRKKTCACLDVRKMWGDMKKEFNLRKSINL
jgi:Dullard-like phosphatase family protein